MKWIGITGSWRATNDQVEADVRKVVRSILNDGNGIVTGGALNVDWFAVDEALRHDKEGKHIKIILPNSLENYSSHYFKRAQEGVITSSQAKTLISQLERLHDINENALIQTKDGRDIDQETYYERNSKVVEVSDEMYAFQVNESAGTQDTINKARDKGIRVTVFSYTIK